MKNRNSEKHSATNKDRRQGNDTATTSQSHVDLVNIEYLIPTISNAANFSVSFLAFFKRRRHFDIEIPLMLT